MRPRQVVLDDDPPPAYDDLFLVEEADQENPSQPQGQGQGQIGPSRTNLLTFTSSIGVTVTNNNEYTWPPRPRASDPLLGHSGGGNNGANGHGQVVEVPIFDPRGIPLASLSERAYINSCLREESLIRLDRALEPLPNSAQLVFSNSGEISLRCIEGPVLFKASHVVTTVTDEYSESMIYLNTLGGACILTIKAPTPGVDEGSGFDLFEIFTGLTQIGLISNLCKVKREFRVKSLVDEEEFSASAISNIIRDDGRRSRGLQIHNKDGLPVASIQVISPNPKSKEEPKVHRTKCEVDFLENSNGALPVTNVQRALIMAPVILLLLEEDHHETNSKLLMGCLLTTCILGVGCLFGIVG